MIKGKTIFILGAGASKPYGFPTGNELRKEICSKFVVDSIKYFQTIGERERALFVNTKKHEAEQFTKAFHKSSIKSIDLFLALNPEYRDMGKFAIIFRILAAEQASKFREEMQNREQDWYSYLYQRLTDGLTKKEDYKRLDENNISFITFNYDRSFEQFMFESLLNSFNGISKIKIIEQLNKLKIIHVFGTMAGLDWQEHPSRIEYKKALRGVDIKEMAKNINIIYEENDNPELEQIHKLISEAERIFFLGFGYAKENLGILKIPGILNKNQKIFGTAFKFTKKERESIKNTFPQTGSPYAQNVFIENMECLRLLREYL